MNLELLPNEILLNLFEYFNCIDLLRAFSGLNYRFNFLLYNQFRLYCFKFNSVSKRNFDMICQQHLPFIADKVIALSLSDYENAPGQIDLFLIYIPSVSKFTHLRSLTLFNLRSYQTLLKLLDEFHHLNNLTHLNFYSCYLPIGQADFQLIIDNIWGLPKLTNCYFDVASREQLISCVPIIISLSLQYLTITSGRLKWSQISQLFHYTPRLKYLSTPIKPFINDDYIARSLPILTKFNCLFYHGSIASEMNIIFQSMPNLLHLDVNMRHELINGHQWEQIIRTYLPHLKTFRLKMEKFLFQEQNIQERADELFNSFRSSFWIDEHQWFCRCIVWKRAIYFYTLSCASSCHRVMFPESWKSTYPQDDNQKFFSSMTHNYGDVVFDRAISSDIHLSNIEYLCIKLPLNDQFWSIISSLNRLQSLSVLLYADTFQSQLQALLDRSSHLSTLTVKQDKSLPLQMSLFNCTNTSVSELDLQDNIHEFNEEDCLTLTSSQLGIQCEVLHIAVKKRECIISIVKNMLNLRILIFKSADDKYHEQLALTECGDDEFGIEKLANDEYVQWLKDYLPSTYFIVRDPEIGINITIWL